LCFALTWVSSFSATIRQIKLLPKPHLLPTCSNIRPLYLLCFQVKSEATSLCWDTLQRHDTKRNPIGVFECQSGGSTSQMFSLSRQWEIRREEICLDTPAGKIDPQSQKIFFAECLDPNLQQFWNHTRKGQIIHSGTGLCVDVSGVTSGQDLLLKTCNPKAESQKWTWQHYLELK